MIIMLFQAYRLTEPFDILLSFKKLAGYVCRPSRQQRPYQLLIGCRAGWQYSARLGEVVEVHLILIRNGSRRFEIVS